MRLARNDYLHLSLLAAIIRWRKFGSDSPDDGTRQVKLLGNALQKQASEKKETECKLKNEKTLKFLFLFLFCFSIKITNFITY